METVKDFNRDDFSLIFDIRFRIWERIKFNFRYQYSIVPIRKNVKAKKIKIAEFGRIGRRKGVHW